MTPIPKFTDQEIGTLTVFDGLHDVETPMLADYVRAIESAVHAKVAEWIKGQVPFAYYVYFPQQQRGEFVLDLDELCEDLTNDENHTIAPLYAHPPAPVAPAGYAIVPVEPTPAMLACIVHCKYPDDGNAGKRLQATQRGENRVPFKSEYESAAGQYMRLLAAAPQAPAGDTSKGAV